MLASANICPGCQHHLRFNAGLASDQPASLSAMRVAGTIEHQGADAQCEYCVVVSIANERGEKLARQVVGVGALQPGERHTYSFSVDLVPVPAPRATASETDREAPVPKPKACVRCR